MLWLFALRSYEARSCVMYYPVRVFTVFSLKSFHLLLDVTGSHGGQAAAAAVGLLDGNEARVD